MLVLAQVELGPHREYIDDDQLVRLERPVPTFMRITALLATSHNGVLRHCPFRQASLVDQHAQPLGSQRTPFVFEAFTDDLRCPQDSLRGADASRARSIALPQRVGLGIALQLTSRKKRL